MTLTKYLRVLLVTAIFVIACRAQTKDSLVRGAWQSRGDSVPFSLTFADNHAFIESGKNLPNPITGHWRVEGNYLMLVVPDPDDKSMTERVDTTEILKIDESSMILKMTYDSLNKSLVTLFKVK